MGRRHDDDGQDARKGDEAESGIGALGDDPVARAALRRLTERVSRGEQTDVADASAQRDARRQLTEAELMREAFLDVDPVDAADEKTSGSFQADDVELVPERPPARRTTRAADGSRGAKTGRRPSKAQPVVAADDVETAFRRAMEARLERGSAPPGSPLPSPLTHNDRKLLRTAKRAHRVAELHLRHLRLDEAIELLEEFVVEERSRGARFVRVICGKGRSSAGEPVLKPAVARWAGTVGAADVTRCIPDLDRSGDFGAYLLVLRDFDPPEGDGRT